MPSNRTLTLLLGSSYAARIPAMSIGLGLILLVRESGRGYANAGLMTGAFVVGSALTAPLSGRLADRFGAPRVVAFGAPLAAGSLAAIASGIATWPAIVLIALSVAAGTGLPPLGALTRGLLAPHLDEARRSRVFTIDGTAQELKDNPDLLHSAYLLRGATAQ